MRCTRCDNETSPAARFCGRCGATASSNGEAAPSSGVLLLEPPSQGPPSAAPYPLPEFEPPPPPAPRRVSMPTVAILCAAILLAALAGAFIGRAGTAAANAGVEGLRARLADAATAQARLTDQVSTANDRLAAQKATEPLRRLVGKRVGELQSYAKSHGWRLRIVRVGSGRQSGTVMTQSPPPGHVMKQGGAIVVRVAA